jgi:hypothetical protein
MSPALTRESALLLAIVMLFTTAVSQAQSVLQTSPSVSAADYVCVKRSPHSKVWQKTILQTNVAGIVRTNVQAYTELAIGLCYVDSATGKYVDSVEQIDLTANGAEAVHGAHKVQWNANANTPNGAVRLTAPGGQQFSSTVYGLSYWDTSTGTNVLIAALRDSFGLVENNHVIYTNAFAGVSADLEYIYTRAGLEQNVVLREQPPSPAEFNLNPNTTFLEVVTMFYNSAIPEKRTETNSGISDDRMIRFDDMIMGQGTAFRTGGITDEHRLKVTKHWQPQADGNAILIEEVPYTALTNLAGLLPLHSSNTKPTGQIRRTASFKVPLQQPSAGRSASGTMKIAKNGDRAVQKPGVVIDYTLNGYDSASSNFIFQSDTTYFISGVWYFNGSPGTLVFEGGTVVKYTNNATIYNYYGSSPGIFEGSPYRPSVLTSWQDNSVGTTIPGSSGSPSLVPSTTYYIEDSGGGSSSNVISNVRFSYADYGYTDYSDPVFTFRDCQFVNCTWATFTPSCSHMYFKNVLCSGCSVIFAGYYYTENVDAENITVDACPYFAMPYTWGPCSYSGGITNSILTACDSSTSDFTTDHSVVASSGTEIYQTVGAGGYYLSDGSPYQNTGTTNIDPVLLADIQAKTTYPPLVVANSSYTTNYTFFPTAQRDTDTPDLGYHYDPLDYAVNLSVSNAIVTIQPGTALAMNGSSYGMWLYTNVVMNSTGTATSPNYIVRYNTVQEQSNTNWETTTWESSFLTPQTTDSSVVNFRFTYWSVIGGSDYHIDSYGVPCPLSFLSCQFYGGAILDNGPTISSTNSLYDRVSLSMTTPSYYNSFYNSLFLGGSLTFTHNSYDTWTFRDNLFDSTQITNVSGANIDICSNNAYVTTSYGVLTPENNDVTLTTRPAYQVGALGQYYYPSGLSLIHAGSQLASAIGLYHYTVTADNAIEGGNMVSIGFHYVAVGANGLPLDTDGDGVPDYLEDFNGNGIFDSGDLGNWQVYNSPNGLTTANGLMVFTPLK